MQHAVPGRYEISHRLCESRPSEWVLRQFESSCKVIIGNAFMNPYEPRERHYYWEIGTQYLYLIWLNPESMPKQPDYWTQTRLQQLSQILKMYELTADGLARGMKRLIAKR